MYLYFVVDNFLYNLRNFCSTIAIDNIRRNIIITYCMHYCDWQLLCTIAIDNFHMHYCSCWLLYLLVWLPIFAATTFVCIIEDYKFHVDHCNWYLLFTLLFRTFSVGTIAYDNIKLHYWNWKLFLHYYNEQLLYATLSNIHHYKWQLKHRVL